MQDDKRKMAVFVMFFFISSIMDLVGIGIIGVLFSMIANGGASSGNVVFPLFYSIIDFSGGNNIAFLLILILIIFSIKGVTAYLIQKSILRYGFRKQREIVNRLIRSYLFSPYSKISDISTAEITNKIYGHANVCAHNMLIPSLRFASEIIIFLAIMLLLFISEPWVTSILIILFSVFIFSYNHFFKNYTVESGQQTSRSTEKMIMKIKETVLGIKEIKILGKEGYFADQVDKQVKKFVASGVKYSTIKILPKYLIEPFVIFMFVLLIMVMEILDRSNTEVVALLGIFGAAALRLIPSTNQIISSLTQMRFATHVINELFKDLNELNVGTGLYVDGSTYIDNEKIKFTKLKFNNVSFKYEEMKDYILTEENITIKAGECVGVVGKSGAGKSTFIDLILGLLEPIKGNIQVNGSHLDENLSTWKQNVAYIPQDVFMIDGTIRQNIALGVEDKFIEEEKISKVIALTKLNDVVNKLPMNVETNIGEAGKYLSGGQNQRLAMARAFYFDKDVVVMDEATSSLDGETELAIVEEIKQLKGSKTFIIIAHKLSTLKNCDYVLKLENGRIERHENIPE